MYPPADLPRTRIDKWLWAARFFKHRTAATEAVDGGRVKLNGVTVKPSREVKPGDHIDLSQDEGLRSLIVCAIADRRGSAAVAQTLYQETPESITRREAEREMRRLAAPPGADLHGRPTKRDRRQMRRFEGG